MSRTTNSFTPTLHQYYSAHAYREAPVLAELRTETARAGAPDGREVHSRNWYVYRLLVAAMALGSGAHITAVDVSAEWTTIGQRFWKKAGVAVGGVTGGVLGAAGSQDHFSQRTHDQVYWNCINRSRFRSIDRPRSLFAKFGLVPITLSLIQPRYRALHEQFRPISTLPLRPEIKNPEVMPAVFKLRAIH